MITFKILDDNGRVVIPAYSYYELILATPVYYFAREEMDLLPEEMKRFISTPARLELLNKLWQKIQSTSLPEHITGCLSAFAQAINGFERNLNLAKKIVETSDLSDNSQAMREATLSQMQQRIEVSIKAADAANIPYPEQKIKREKMLQDAVRNLLTLLPLSPFLVQDDNENLSIFEQLKAILCEREGSNYTSADFYRIFDLIKQFNFPGIDISLELDDSLNQQRLDRINFPSNVISSEYLCNLTGQIMTEPYITNNTTVDYQQFLSACKKPDGTYINCYDRSSWTPPSAPAINHEVQTHINLLVEKAEWLYTRFKNTHLEKYKIFSATLNNPQMSLDDFKKIVEPENKTWGLGFLGKKKPSSQKVTTEKETHELRIREAAAQGNLSALNELLSSSIMAQKNIDINAAGQKTGQTALHRVIIGANKSGKSSSEQYEQCYELLLTHGASFDILDNQQKTPADYDTNQLFPYKPLSSCSSSNLT